PVSEIEELLVPTFGMEEPGLLRETWGDYRISVAFIGTSGAEWNWQGADGKPQNPAKVKKAHPEAWKALKETAGDIQKLLTAQRDRIERMLLVEREWDYSTWRTLHLDHPLLAVLARRLIWEFQTDGRTETGIWQEGQIVDVGGRTLEYRME